MSRLQFCGRGGLKLRNVFSVVSGTEITLCSFKNTSTFLSTDDHDVLSFLLFRLTEPGQNLVRIFLPTHSHTYILV